MTIGELNRRIEVLENQVKRDEYGGEESNWITVGRVWAKVEPSSGKEFLAGQQVQAEATTKFTIRFYPALNVMHRIRYQDKTYEIVSVGDLETSHKWTVVMAKEMVSDGLQRKQRKVKVQVEGATKIAKELKSMEDSASSVLLKGARAGGEIALEDARRNCPEDTGALKASLKLTDGKVTTTKATIQVDYDKSLKYGTHVELGARGRPANPFLRNAVDDNQDKINEAIVKEITKALGV